MIVTGATGGIGQGIAEYLADLNYDLILTSRSEDRLKALCESIDRLNVDSVQNQAVDFCSLESIQEYQCWMEKTDQKIDGIVLITPRPSAKDSLFPESGEWSELFQSAFVGPLEFVKLMLPHLNKGGKIVVISGITSIQYMDGHTMYGVLRTMWLSQAKAMSYELGPKEIYVNTVSPGGVLTEHGISKMQRKANEKEINFEKQYAESTHNVPLRKYAQPQDIASVVEFFLSSRSDHVTGVNLTCDGGFTRGY